MKTSEQIELENAKMKEILLHLLHDLGDLMDNSEGISGLHRNGDIAEWDSLRSGGAFEGWLMSFDEALNYVENSNA